jgi:hypothetical protein
MDAKAQTRRQAQIALNAAQKKSRQAYASYVAALSKRTTAEAEVRAATKALERVIARG